MNFLRSSDGRAIILHFLCGRGNIIFGFRIQDFIVRRYQNPAYQEVYRNEKSKCEKTCPCRDSCCCGNRMFSFVYPGRSIQVCSGSAFYFWAPDIRLEWHLSPVCSEILWGRVRCWHFQVPCAEHFCAVFYISTENVFLLHMQENCSEHLLSEAS